MVYYMFQQFRFFLKFVFMGQKCAAAADLSIFFFFTCLVFFVSSFQISIGLSNITSFTILTLYFVNTWFINIDNFLYRCSYRWQLLRGEFVSEVAFQHRISGFTHRHLNQLDHQETYTNSETNLSLIRISIQDSQNVILYCNSY